MLPGYHRLLGTIARYSNFLLYLLDIQLTPYFHRLSNSQFPANIQSLRDSVVDRVSWQISGGHLRERSLHG